MQRRAMLRPGPRVLETTASSHGARGSDRGGCRCRRRLWPRDAVALGGTHLAAWWFLADRGDHTRCHQERNSSESPKPPSLRGDRPTGFARDPRIPTIDLGRYQPLTETLGGLGGTTAQRHRKAGEQNSSVRKRGQQPAVPLGRLGARRCGNAAYLRPGVRFSVPNFCIKSPVLWGAGGAH